MKKNIKKFMAAGMTVLTITSMALPTFAASTRDVSRDSSSISIEDGKAEFVSKKTTEFENEHKSALTSKQITVNTQKVKVDGGKIKFLNEQETSYKDSSGKVIADIKVDLNAPIIYGEADVEFENKNTATHDNVDADYVKIYEFTYNNPFYVNK